MNIRNIRERMNLVESYTDPTPEDDGVHTTFRLSIYRTSRPGVYGYQFAAILWAFAEPGGPYASSLTSGCGYNKIASCTEEALAKLAYAKGDPTPYDLEAVRLAGSGEIFKALARAFDVPSNAIYFVGP